jgi:predicted enzyme related to lactoylglutathione lyase
MNLLRTSGSILLKDMSGRVRHPVVHLELRTSDPAAAGASLEDLFGWTTERIEAAGHSYVALALGRVDGGIVATDGGQHSWLPYVEVDDIDDMTERARLLSASVVLPPTEGPVGWRAILGIPSGVEIALWQPKR